MAHPAVKDIIWMDRPVDRTCRLLRAPTPRYGKLWAFGPCLDVFLLIKRAGREPGLGRSLQKSHSCVQFVKVFANLTLGPILISGFVIAKFARLFAW